MAWKFREFRHALHEHLLAWIELVLQLSASDLISDETLFWNSKLVLTTSFATRKTFPTIWNRQAFPWDISQTRVFGYCPRNWDSRWNALFTVFTSADLNTSSENLLNWKYFSFHSSNKEAVRRKTVEKPKSFMSELRGIVGELRDKLLQLKFFMQFVIKI